MKVTTPSARVRSYSSLPEAPRWSMVACASSAVNAAKAAGNRFSDYYFAWDPLTGNKCCVNYDGATEQGEMYTGSGLAQLGLIEYAISEGICWDC